MLLTTSRRTLLLSHLFSYCLLQLSHTILLFFWAALPLVSVFTMDFLYFPFSSRSAGLTAHHLRPWKHPLPQHLTRAAWPNRSLFSLFVSTGMMERAVYLPQEACLFHRERTGFLAEDTRNKPQLLPRPPAIAPLWGNNSWHLYGAL